MWWEWRATHTPLSHQPPCPGRIHLRGQKLAKVSRETRCFTPIISSSVYFCLKGRVVITRWGVVSAPLPQPWHKGGRGNSEPWAYNSLGVMPWEQQDTSVTAVPDNHMQPWFRGHETQRDPLRATRSWTAGQEGVVGMCSCKWVLEAKVKLASMAWSRITFLLRIVPELSTVDDPVVSCQYDSCVSLR